VFRFITSKPFWVNLLAAIALIAILVFVFLKSLNFFTNHGKVLKVPSVKGMTFEEASQFLEEQGFSVSIQDSVYVDTARQLTVIRQFPDPETSVKIHRTVYLTITRAVPPIIEMPNLLNMSYRSADDYLKSIGLKLGDTSYRPDFAKNAVIEQLVDGKEIKPGTKIPMGSVVSLVFGSGISDEEINVPDLVGLTAAEADALLAASGLSRGSTVIDPNVRDTGAAFIYRQEPQRYGEEGKINRIRPGQLITVWLSLQRPAKIDTTNLP